MNKRLKIASTIFITIFFFLLSYYLLYLKIQIREIDHIPAEFDRSKFQVNFKDGTTFLQINGIDITPIVDDDEGALLVLSGKGNGFVMHGIFKAYEIDNINKEIIIYRNSLNTKQTSKPFFEIIKIPKEKYKSIIVDGTVRIRTKFAFLQDYVLLEYDLKSNAFKQIETVTLGK